MRAGTVIAFGCLLAVSAPTIAQTAPAAQTAAPAPETLASARRVVARLLPPGTYKQMMSGSMNAMTANMGDALKAIPLGKVAQMSGMSLEDAKKIDKLDLERIMAIYDPHWQERQQLTMHGMFDAMGDFFATMEPELREGMARAYAHRFSPAELNDLDRYFATPIGAKFAANATTIMTDPALMDTMKDMMPKMMKAMPQFMAAAQKATAALPPPRKLQDLSPADKARLAKAMGIEETKLRDPKTS